MKFHLLEIEKGLLEIIVDRQILFSITKEEEMCREKVFLLDVYN